jgi:preprotein translocase subunit SecF
VGTPAFSREDIMTSVSFVEHPASVGESYSQHLRHASWFSVRMAAGALAVGVHAIFPFLFTRTGSAILSSLYHDMVSHRTR